MAVRLAVAAALMFGPATDEVSELAGWDAERFQEIADRDGPAWADEPVEYPPGSVVVFDRLAGSDVVETHRRLVALSVVVDLGVAFALARRIGSGSGAAYLWLGLPLIPFGYQRLDTLVTAIAVVGALALVGGSGRRVGPGRAVWLDAVVAVSVAAGALIKVWPMLLVVGAIAIGRWRAAIAATVLTAAGGVAWLATTGAGLDPVDQVLSLRGATGWHVESLPGAVVALFSTDPAQLELNAYRIGTLRPGLVTAGRGLAVLAMAALALAGWRRIRTGAPESTDRRAPSGAVPMVTVFATVTLGSVAALLVTAPLLSPQFLVWLTPWAALLIGDRSNVAGPVVITVRRAVALTALSAMLTGIALHGFGPADLAATGPAALLTVRNLALAGLVVVCLSALRSSRRPGPASDASDAASPEPHQVGPE